MKTADLIRRLQEADPSGELECCVGGDDIYFVERLPAYYDGPHTILTRDPAKAPYWNITGATINYYGEKVKLHVVELADLIWGHPEIPVAVRPEGRMVREEDRIERLRAEGREMNEEAAAIRAGKDK